MKDGRARNVEAPFVRRPHNFDVAFFFVVVVVPSFIFFFPSSCLGQVRHRRFHRLAFCFVFVVFFVALWTIFKKKRFQRVVGPGPPRRAAMVAHLAVERISRGPQTEFQLQFFL